MRSSPDCGTLDTICRYPGKPCDPQLGTIHYGLSVWRKHLRRRRILGHIENSKIIMVDRLQPAN